MDEKRILIVDANKTDREQIASFCREFNFKVGILSEAQNLFDDLKADRPDLLILGLNFPDDAGFELLKKIRSDAKTKKIPLIVVAELDQEAAIAKSKKSKDAADAYLFKPMDPDDLIEHIEELVGLPTPPLSPSQDRAMNKAEKVKDVLVKAKSEMEDQAKSQSELLKALEEKRRECDMLKESYENIKRRVDEMKQQNQFIEEDLRRKDDRVLSMEEEYQGRAVQVEAQIKSMRERHEQEMAEKLKQNEGLVSQVERITAEAEESKKKAETAERRNHLLEQENIQRENGLKERIKELLSKVDEADQLQEGLKQSLEDVVRAHETEIAPLKEEIRALTDEKIKMEQRVIKAYKKIKMDQLRDQKLEKALEVAMILLKSENI